MTYPIHTRQQLQFLSLAELKAIAQEIGAEPADKRSKASYIQAILDMSAIEIATNSPEFTTNSPEIGNNSPEITTTHSTHQELCLTTTGTRNLHELKEWCENNSVDQTEEFSTLYRKVLCKIANFPQPAVEQLSFTLGCIDRTIQDNALMSECILTELGVSVMDLSLEYDDILIPHGHDAYWVMVTADKVASISTWGNGYVSSRSEMGGCDDPYTAALEVVEWMVGAGEVAIARATVQRDMGIKNMQFTDNEKAIFSGARDNNFENCFEETFDYPNTTWVFAVIDKSGLDPKVARGAIASLVKKGMVEINDYEGKGDTKDMTFCLTTEGLKAGNLLLMPEYM
jgi:hypothetical protein